MKDLREEVGTKYCIVGKLVQSRMKWAGHMVRMIDESLPNISETKKQEDCKKRVRPQLRWEDCVKRDLGKAEEEDKLREKANNKDQWIFVYKSSHTMECQLDQSRPYRRETRGRQI